MFPSIEMMQGARGFIAREELVPRCSQSWEQICANHSLATRTNRNVGAPESQTGGLLQVRKVIILQVI